MSHSMPPKTPRQADREVDLRWWFSPLSVLVAVFAVLQLLPMFDPLSQAGQADAKPTRFQLQLHAGDDYGPPVDTGTLPSGQVTAAAGDGSAAVDVAASTVTEEQDHAATF